MTRSFGLFTFNIFMASALWLSPTVSHAKDLTPMAAPEDDSATVSSIDDWKPKTSPHPKVVVASLPVMTPVAAEMSSAIKPQVVATPPAIKKAALPTESPVVPIPTTPHVDMNEMTGHLASVDSDDQTLRLTVDGGFNPQFAYDSQTTVNSHGKKLTIEDLVPGDKVIVRYVGKEMTAREIERSNVSPAAQPR